MNLSEITIAYGMTETSPVSFQSSTADPLERRVSTVGLIQPHLEVKIVDLNGRIVPPGMPGELLTRGYSVMLGYWADEQRTREAIDAARWMHTGDLATMDEDGYINIVGRSKEMIIRGGENVYPREIEEYLYTHPAIADVHVIGVNVLKVQAKPKRRGMIKGTKPGWKKAIVQLREGETIEIFEGAQL